MTEPNFRTIRRNDNDGHLKAAALRAAVAWWASSPSPEDATTDHVLATARGFYEWLRTY